MGATLQRFFKIKLQSEKLSANTKNSPGANNKKAPLCKGSCHSFAVTEGLLYDHFAGSQNRQYYSDNPSGFCCAKPTSLYTREAWVWFGFPPVKGTPAQRVGIVKRSF